ncbi:o-succinylbenzoate synthase [Bacillus badius]|uniref:o-succinylbenzoate synthase n=1 Tax=Bacillus badius TaxID=1455 RepID=A0ABR5AVF3_BACBA|nr:o-succinylbenzoate synthase [Bacillus badius]KIL76618.1 O-succinylbenzoate synthase [Bacillus badius]KIL78737.1 O-succinylbenzoate synthase [Bacillus badius]MED4717978.1 o-succinylbenzoate synthase [Bacillus badius]
MKSLTIKEVVLHHVNVELIAPFTTSFGTMENKDVCLVEVIDESGISGWGETVTSNEPYYNEETTFTTVYMLKEFLIPRLIHQQINHPAEVHDMLQFVRRNNIAKAALETAIWDAFAKKNNQSIAELLGGTKKEIEVGKSIGIQQSPAVLVEKVRQYAAEGFRKIKVKIKPGADIDYIDAVRAEFPDIALMADANSAYTLADADHLKKLDQYKLLMIEQPLAHDDIIDHATLQKTLETPVCLDESIHSLEDARKAIELGSCQIINIKIGRVGGLYESKRIHDLCAEHNIPVWCGGMLETGVGRAHNIQLTALHNFTIPGDTAPSSHYWSEDIVTPEITMNNGVIYVPSEIGIGYEVDHEKLAKVLVRTEKITTAETPHPIPS